MSKNIGIFSIVEGHGEVPAVPVLLRRFAHEIYNRYDFDVLTPFRLPRSKYAKDDELMRSLLLGSVKLSEYSKPHILIIMDADDDCPVTEQQRLSRLILNNNFNVPVSLVMPYREYETWFNTSIGPGTNHATFKAPYNPSPNAHGIRDAKGYFERNYLNQGVFYSETVDQQKYTSLIDLQANDDRSFRKMRKEMSIIFN
ncbi:hypothetical protein [Microvirga arsenatis]|uniref:DUF4276 family protein n=1 Tax=Microvirga arsenatis TaxID=2692265 RepID=A0ABW9YY98_9HYPH|nr:hypothetical protein [Microvirga arsenatis]NBJ09346.1 hypothetical protein [Microvirga arsenatis]NBJ23796.1 hypothetical protein [Microvirga arsenatis]